MNETMPRNPYFEIVAALDLDDDIGGFDFLGTGSEMLREIAESFVQSEPWAESFVRPVLAEHNGNLNPFSFRNHFRRAFAFAIPSPAAVRKIADLGTIVEIGAGTGYWAKLLSDHGATVRAFDDGSWKLPKRWYPVKRGGAISAGRVEADALLLCWPPYKKRMARIALNAFRGSRVAYVGEGGWGCTGDDGFHEELDRDWDLLDEVRIPQWVGVHDRLYIYERKGNLP